MKHLTKILTYTQKKSMETFILYSLIINDGSTLDSSKWSNSTNQFCSPHQTLLFCTRVNSKIFFKKIEVSFVFCILCVNVKSITIRVMVECFSVNDICCIFACHAMWLRSFIYPLKNETELTAFAIRLCGLCHRVQFKYGNASVWISIFILK